MGVYISSLNKLIMGFFVYEKVDKGTALSPLINSLLLSQSLSFGDGDKSRYNYLCIILHFSYFQINSANALDFNCTITHFTVPPPDNGEM